MAKARMDLSAFVGKLLEEQDGDVLREGIRVLSQALMESEVAGLIGAERHERTGERTAYRNGSRMRTWDTRMGTIELAIPKVRPGTYFPSFPQDRVPRLDLKVSAADWQSLMDDMASMTGAFGSGGLGGTPPGGGGGAGDFPPGAGGGIPPGGGVGAPTAESIAACSGKVEGDVCALAAVPSGRCARAPGAQPVLACVSLPGGAPNLPGGPGAGPNPGGGANPGAGRDDVELLPRTPIYIPATVTFDGEVFEWVGLRLKGNSTLLNSWRAGVEKLPMRLNFDEFESTTPAVRDQTFFGFQNLNLTNNSSDASFLRAKIGHDLFREAGVPSSRTSYTRVYLDKGDGPQYFGLYTLVESLAAPC